MEWFLVDFGSKILENRMFLISWKSWKSRIWGPEFWSSSTIFRGITKIRFSKNFGGRNFVLKKKFCSTNFYYKIFFPEKKSTLPKYSKTRFWEQKLSLAKLPDVVRPSVWTANQTRFWVFRIFWKSSNRHPRLVGIFFWNIFFVLLMSTKFFFFRKKFRPPKIFEKLLFIFSRNPEKPT